MNKIDSKFLKKPIPIADQKWDENIEPVVSIGCLTYNHEKYIRNAIEGFLIQKTTFPVEIIIHDDASTDKTANIIKEYAEKYPNLIFPIYQVENKYQNGINPWANFVTPRTRGKYIASCEGDDYWTDPQKLQKQIDFLEANPDYSLCSHEAYYTYINDPNSFRKFAAILYHNYKLDGVTKLIKLLKLFVTRNHEFWNRRRKSSKIKRYPDADFEIALNTASSDRYIPTLSIVARAKYRGTVPLELYKYSAGHRLGILWTALHGKQKHFKDVMGMKNTQENSVTVTKVHIKDKTKERRIYDTIMMYKILSEYADGDRSELINKKIQEAYNKSNVKQE